MFKKKSIAGRIATGKVVGFITGIVAVLLAPVFDVPMFTLFSLGIIMFFVFMGAIIGMVGQFDRHPLFNFKMSWPLVGAMVGFSMTLMLIFLGYDELELLMDSVVVEWTGLESPFWMLIDGTLLGMMIAWIEKKCAGSGSDLPLQ